MSLMFEPLRKYATFSGRARRREYWLFILFVSIVSTALLGLATIAIGPTVMADVMAQDPESLPETNMLFALALLAFALFQLAILIPSIAVMVRRLHDTGNSGWWILLNLVPGGTIVLFIFALIDGTRGPNRHGPDPKGRQPESY